MSSSDDDIMGLLPTGRGGRGRTQAPSRLRNFKAMMSESSDEEPQRTPPPKPTKKPLPDLASPVPATATPPISAQATPTTPTPPAVSVRTPPAVVPEDDDESTDGTDSIQFLEGDEGASSAVAKDDTDEVSMDLQSTMDDITPAKPSHRQQEIAAKQSAPPAPSVPSTDTPPTPSPVKASPIRTEGHFPTAAAMDHPTRPSSPPLVRAADTATQPVENVRVVPIAQVASAHVEAHDENVVQDDNDLLHEILPLHPKGPSASKGRVPAAPAVHVPRARSPSANATLLSSAAHLPPPSPMRADPLEELLIRAQQRLKEKERLDQSLGSLPPPGPPSRQSSPLRPLESRRIDASFPASAAQNAPLFSSAVPSPSDATATREFRLQKENQRLAEELGFLTKENQKLRGQDTSASANEVHKLQVHVEVLKQQLKEVEMDAQRTKQYLEEQLQDAQQHERHMKDELKSYAATADQVDAMCREKDARLLEAQQQVTKLQASVAERSADVRRAEEEGRRAREDDKTKLERTLQLFEDVKKQRVQLQDLNDKFQRDKEAAVVDKRRVTEEYRNAEREWSKERDRLTDESDALHRDVERYRQLLSEKERTLSAQILEEQRAKEHFQSRLADLEESATVQAQTLQSSLRSTQEELRRVQEDLNKSARVHADEAKELRRLLEDQTKEFALQVQRERSAVVKEMSEKITLWKEQRDASDERRRVAEEQLERVAQERDMLRREVERSTEVNAQWQRAKDKAEMQCVQLKTSLEQIIAQDEQLVNDSERYRAELEAAYQDISNLRAEVEQSFHLEKQLQELSAENDRISDECNRVTEERNGLIHENAKMAEEMIRWRNEMKDLFAAQKRSTTSFAASSAVIQPASRSGSQRAVRALSTNDFTF